MSGRRGSGSFGSGRTAGYAIGEERTSPWLEAIAGIRQRSCPRLGSKPVPAPRTRSEVRASLSVGFSPPRPQQAPPPERQKRCAGQGVRGSSGVRASGCLFLKSYYGRLSSARHVHVYGHTYTWQSSWGRGIPDSILVPLTVSGSCWVAWARAPSSLLHVASVPGRLSCVRVGIGYRAPPVSV